MKKLVSVICLILAALLSFTSCAQARGAALKLLGGGEEAAEPRAVSVVLGAHANFPFADAVSHIYDDVYGICSSGGEISFIVADGKPFIAADYALPKQDTSYSRTRRRELAEENASVIMSKASSLAAVTPELDTLTALSLAADKLRASECADKTLIVIDSCLSTAGLIDFAAYCLIEESPEDIVSALEERRALPELDGVSVHVTGLGRVSGAQSALSADMLDKLRGIWTAIFVSSGALEVVSDPTPLSDAGSGNGDGLPEVSVVAVISDPLTPTKTAKTTEYADDGSFGGDEVEENKESEDALGEAVRFDETSVRFKPDSAELTDRDAAARALSYAGGLLAADPELRVYLIGTTASFGGDGEKLSLERAEEVKKLLTEMGCGEEQITCRGFGRRQSILRVKDTDSAGNLLPDKAKLNRAVFLIASGSAAARSLGLE